eukprot:TRINITY_DN12692_c5_g1_i1.p1 TRINITY_DN12692_c5_g1~~TRINITY_DN12692_c5_g1_i1.p1  ORF type:complete len:168 (+),score=4.21 TRINITY_DN12692_c5_g1_i1:316-819(+)
MRFLLTKKKTRMGFECHKDAVKSRKEIIFFVGIANDWGFYYLLFFFFFKREIFFLVTVWFIIENERNGKKKKNKSYTKCCSFFIPPFQSPCYSEQLQQHTPLNNEFLRFASYLIHPAYVILAQNSATYLSKLTTRLPKARSKQNKAVLASGSFLFPPPLLFSFFFFS